jgi:LPXTG-motif cell wall-anchored protein
MRNFLPRVALVGAFFTLVVASSAGAHVVVSPEEVAAGDYETLIVSVPTEKEVPTTEIRVEVPEGFVLSGVQPVPGWEYAFEEDGGLITAVTWSGGEIRPREFQQFLIQAQAPEEPGEYPWKALQTYEDGSIVEWTGPPDAEEPASVVEVVSGSSEGQGSGAGAPEEANSAGEGTMVGADTDTLASTGGTSPLVYAALGVGALALGALLVRRLVRS